MKKRLVLFIFALCSAHSAQARFFVGAIGARYDLDYEGIRINEELHDIKGEVELVGISTGISHLAPGFGYELAAAFIGTNSQKLTPNPDWGVPWYYRLSAKGNYMLPFGLYFLIGSDLMGSVSQATENRYFGVGAMVGIGYRINDRVSVSISNPNSSVLFAGDDKKVLRGVVLEGVYGF